MPILARQTREEKRLENKQYRKWGPYLGERQWATVREDYSHDGDAWLDFPFEHSHSRTYRWGEDGLAGVCDYRQLVCMLMALWNGKDEILKEKAFGVTNSQGNHGEDVKELYYYLDNVPSHSYMKYLYKYPHAKFPYKELVAENGRRLRHDHEYEITDTDLFAENKYFDVVFEMAKADDDPEELLFRITAYNRGPDPAPLHILPHLVMRNTWAWGTDELYKKKPHVRALDKFCVEVDHDKFGPRYWVFAPAPGIDENLPDIEPELLFTENETNTMRLYQQENQSPFVKDAFHDHVVSGKIGVTNPEKHGTKVCAWFKFDEGVAPGDYVTVRYKLSKLRDEEIDEYQFDQVFARRQDEANAFYLKISPTPISDHLRQVQRQAFAGLLWTKQFYHFVHAHWAKGDPNTPRPPANRANGRNKDWKHLFIDDILSLPDKWEYPFFAAWDTAFHCIPLAMIDPYFAKRQIDLLLREWYQHPNGQIPAYEWNFSDVNPPVHAWAAYRIFKIERKMYGTEDLEFLERVFQKLMLNFMWWVNRKDHDGKNIFQGGFLGLDNIGVFNRLEALPTGGNLEQADLTGWMAFFSLEMLNIALELAKTRPVYQNIASKFFEHFILIADAMSYSSSEKEEEEGTSGDGEDINALCLWDNTDKFYYDSISYHKGHTQALKVRSLVGLIPLYASLTLEPRVIERFPDFKRRLEWFTQNHRTVSARNIETMETRGMGERLLLSLVNKERLVAILDRMLNEEEFLSPYGIRSLSKFHKEHPFKVNVGGQEYSVEYLPGESDSGMFGGNSNWRGPIWFPVNFMLVESLQRFYLYYGHDLKVECPKGSGEFLNLAQCAQEIQHRLIHLFVPDVDGNRACNGENEMVNHDPLFKDNVSFYEYFDGDTGRGLGASHQCGWTAVVAKWIHDNGLTCRVPKTPRRSSSVGGGGGGGEPENDYADEPDHGDMLKFIPKLGPFPGERVRRKLSKSLLSMTVRALDLDEEESETHSRNRAARAHSEHVPVNASDVARQAQLERAASTSSCHSQDENENLMEQVQNAFSRFRFHSDESPMNGDEFETRCDETGCYRVPIPKKRE